MSQRLFITEDGRSLQILKDVYKAASSKKGLPDSEVDTEHPSGMGIGTTPDDLKVGKNWHGTKKSTKVSGSVSAVLSKEGAETIKKTRSTKLKKSGFIHPYGEDSRDIPLGEDYFTKVVLPKVVEAYHSGGASPGATGTQKKKFQSKMKEVADKVGQESPAHVITEGKPAAGKTDAKTPKKEEDGPFRSGYKTGLSSTGKTRGGKSPLLVVARKVGQMISAGGRRGGKVSAGSTKYTRGRVQRPRTSRR